MMMRSQTLDSSRWTGAPGEFRPPRYASPQPCYPDGRPWPTAGRLVGRWQQRYLVHGEGDALGEPVRLGLFWWYILNRIFEFHPETGALAHDRVLIGMGKGNDKTEGGARLGAADAMGPVAPLRSPRVVLSATSYDQTRELFEAARLTILGDPDNGRPGPLASYFRAGDHIMEDRIILPDRPGRIERIAAVGGTNDGGKPTIHIGDEVHELDTERKERVYIVQGKSVRKRRVPRRTPAELGLPPGVVLSGALQVGITTAGPSMDSLLGRLYEHGVRVATGQVEDPGFLFLWWEADDALDLDDPADLDQAILQANPAVVVGTPSAGAFLPIANKRASYHDPTVPRHEAIRYDLNRWPRSELQWMPVDVWDDCVSDLALSPTEPSYACVRVAQDHRSVAVAIAQRAGERVLLRCRVFDVEELLDGETLDVRGVERHLLELHATYRARVLASRRWSPKGKERLVPMPGPEVAYHGSFFERSAQALKERGLVMVDLPSSQATIAPAAETLMELALARKLSHDGDPDLTRQMFDVDAKPAVKGWTLVPASPTARIHGAVASILAVHRAMTAPRPQSRRMRIT